MSNTLDPNGWQNDANELQWGQWATPIRKRYPVIKIWVWTLKAVGNKDKTAIFLR